MLQDSCLFLNTVDGPHKSARILGPMGKLAHLLSKKYYPLATCVVQAVGSNGPCQTVSV